MRSTFIEVVRPAQMGDTVRLDFRVSVNGQVIEGGESKNHPVQLGEGHFVPGFEDKVVGILAGDERDFTINFPKDYAHKDYQGVAANVWVKAHSVQKRVIPELTDEFARGLGKFSSLQHLRHQLTKNIRADKEQREKDRWQGELAAKLAEITSFGPLPSVLIDKEIDRRVQEFEQMLTYQHMTLDMYLQKNKQGLADFRADMRESAEQTVKANLALRAFADQEQINVSDQEIEEKSKEFLSQFATSKEAARKIDPEELKENVAGLLRNQKTLRRLEEVATVKEEMVEEKKDEVQEKAKQPAK
jgi:trigger factor